MNRRYISIALAIAVFAGLTLCFVFGIPALERAAATKFVEDFGAQLQSVFVLGPNASSTIAATYGEYAEQHLLQEWQREPEAAPGRLTSSPWPSRIEIDSASSQGSGYVMSGDVVYETSAGEAGRAPLLVFVVKREGQWRIAAYEEKAVE